MITSNIEITRVTSQSEIIDIRDLQALNLKQNITYEEATVQGFLTAEYTINYLEEMNSVSPSIIAKDGEKVIGYSLVATKEIRKGHVLLEGLFDAIDECTYNGKLLRDVNYVVVGQLCVAKEYRGLGLVQQLYGHFRDCLSNKFVYLVTDVAKANVRSLKAHKKRGFQVINELTYDDVGFDIVLWDWNATNQDFYKKS
ncbi:MAG: GNAT family N-acetyltransferase [Bacteroidetes bacterium]|nr:GNAT family N-acetyltransferase [Bacteroidota bacterium]